VPISFIVTLYIEKEIYNLCSLQNNMKVIKSKENVMGCGTFKYIEILVCNSERMSHLERPRHKWGDNIK
jgi:hypothetical protein